MAEVISSYVSSGRSSNILENSRSTLTSDYSEDLTSDFYDVKKQGIVNVLGSASDGRSVMVILPCNIPNEDRVHFDYNLLRRYATALLNVNSDTEYYVVYFHCETVSETSNTKLWLKDLFDHVTEKDGHQNVYRLYIVHPTHFIRTLWYLSAPLMLWKFKQKIQYANTLRHLTREVPYGELVFKLPLHVLEQDKMIEDRCRSNLQDELRSRSLVPQQVMDTVKRFRKSNEEVQDDRRKENDDAGVPFAIKHCVDYLSDPQILSIEDLFLSSNYNISGSHLVMDALRKGIALDLDDYKDPAIVAAVLKQFFREMAEPLFPYDLYDDVVAFNNFRDKMAAARTLVLYRLPKKSFRPLTFLLAFLLRVLDFQSVNHSSSHKMAVIFAPLILRSRDSHISVAESTIEMYDSIEFIKFLLDNFLRVFTF